MPLELDHIIPEALNGTSDETNLWLACPRCNRYKGMQIEATDEISGEVVPLFNPRQEQWQDHFVWEEDGLYIAGTTAIGRATVAALQLNNPFVVYSRKVWIDAGWHPPKVE